MKALITAGGRATRLRPITHTLNKHLIPLAGEPMIFHAIRKIAEAGITEIAINVNPGDTSIAEAVGDGSRWGVKITCIEQVGGPKGLAHIVKNARNFLGDEPFLFYLGDNIVLGSLDRFVKRFERGDLSCLLALSKVSDPQRFGVPEIVNGRIIRVDEKPLQPKSDFAVTGIYIYSSDVFDAVEAIDPSPRGEFEISDAHTWLIQHGFAVGYEEITGWWKDTGKPDDLLSANVLLLAEMPSASMVNQGEVQPGAQIAGPVRIGRGTKIDSRTVIVGPVTIGDDCVIEGAIIGPNVSIGNRVRLSWPKIENTIVLDGASIVCPLSITSSLIGSEALIEPSEAGGPVKSMLISDHSVVRF